MRRGEIRWYTFAAPDKRRPVLLLTRDSVIDGVNEIIVVPATRTIRGIATEVVLTTDDGMHNGVRAEFRPRCVGETRSDRRHHHEFVARALGGS